MFGCEHHTEVACCRCQYGDIMKSISAMSITYDLVDEMNKPLAERLEDGFNLKKANE